MSKGQSAENAKTSAGFSIFTSLKTNGSDPNIEVWKKFVSFEKKSYPRAQVGDENPWGATPKARKAN